MNLAVYMNNLLLSLILAYPCKNFNVVLTLESQGSLKGFLNNRYVDTMPTLIAQTYLEVNFLFIKHYLSQLYGFLKLIAFVVDKYREVEMIHDQISWNKIIFKNRLLFY